MSPSERFMGNANTCGNHADPPQPEMRRVGAKAPLFANDMYGENDYLKRRSKFD